ncbi:bifunctional metallophosphatase/5'-nucleotidase [Streptomyces vilmorinianum]|uniref:bifunctional metallophosphatase/5'-nucleotidase n=1 Tax=Streptomyces vilmorinianum TaxID=3051092 RepID=UPI0010FB9AF7|nr:bifunctional metallophosphatase/5'-nucleotidase [Streptomyces vilmorinianum]
MPTTSQNQHRRRRTHRLLAAVAGLTTVGALAVALPGTASAGQNGHSDKQSGRYQDIQLLSFNDFHGNLEAPTGSSGRLTEIQPDGSVKTIEGVGGVEYLAGSLRTARQGHPYSITAAAGDLIGGSPLISALFHDEPTIEAMNALDLDVTGVGNHEFDEGAAELKRMQDGGCHPKDGCYAEGRTFEGAQFPYLAANVVDEKTGKPMLDPTFVWEKDGIKVGFIGVTLEGTADIVTADGVKGLKFLDETETINKYARQLQKRGVKSIVALIHEGGAPASDAYNYGCDGNGPGTGISGPIVDIAKGVDAKVDALVTGHTHAAYACTIPDPEGKPRTVTSAASFGRLYTDTTLTYDRRTRDIVRTSVKSANHVVVRKDPAGDMTDLIARYKAISSPIENRPIGWIAAGAAAPSGPDDSPLGNLIADAQLAYAKSVDPSADLALMNPGGVRDSLVYASSPAGEGDGVVTYGEAFRVQPFGNTVNLLDLTGAQLLTVLQQQVTGPKNEGSPKVLQPSSGLSYTLDLTKTGADRVVADSVRLNGAPLDPAATYRVAVNSFLAGGGDGFGELAKGTNRLVGVDDLLAFETYLRTSSASAPLPVPAADRINVVYPPKP